MSDYEFRTWVDNLEKDNKLLRVSTEIDTLDDLGAFVSRCDYKGVDTPILFDNPKGFDIPVLANTVGHKIEAICAAHGVGTDGDGALPNIANRMVSVLKSGGIAPEFVDKANAPCKEVIMTGDDVDLSVIPIPRCNPSDGQGAAQYAEGRFITSLAISKPTPDSHNLSYHRFEITRKDGGSIWIYRGTGDARSMEVAWGAGMDDPEETYDPDKGEPYPLAFVFGVTPEVILAGANKALPHEGEDFAYIGGLRGEPVKLVPCETVDIDVPADAEIIVEGIMKPFNWTTQGAFASFNGSYDEARRRPIFDVTAITMRKKPIYQHVHIGRPLNETNSLAGIFRGVHVFNEVKAVLPNIVDLYMDPSAGIGFTIHLSIKKGRVGEPKLAMMRAYTALQGFCKHVFVYDDDVDIYDHNERSWALAHRFIPDRDLLIIPNVLGMVLEPMAQGVMGSNSKLGLYDGYPEIPLNVRSFMGVDCTVPLGIKNKVMKRVVTLPEIEARVDGIWDEVFS